LKMARSEKSFVSVNPTAGIRKWAPEPLYSRRKRSGGSGALSGNGPRPPFDQEEMGLPRFDAVRSTFPTRLGSTPS
jgi:hypothetical protein